MLYSNSKNYYVDKILFNLLNSTVEFHKVDKNLATIIAYYAYFSHHKDNDNCYAMLEQLKKYKSKEYFFL